MKTTYSSLPNLVSITIYLNLNCKILPQQSIWGPNLYKLSQIKTYKSNQIKLEKALHVNLTRVESHLSLTIPIFRNP